MAPQRKETALNIPLYDRVEGLYWDYGMYITECTLELQRLPGGELAKLAGGQGKLVSLKLQSDGSLWLG